jgi:single-strand DNA-binding protein
VNIVHIAGHLGADPEVRFTSSGQKVTTLRLAAKTRKGGKDDTIWWRVTIWGDQFDKMMPYLKKGSPIMAIGELVKPEIFTDRDGNPQISMNMTASQIMFSPFGRGDKPQEQANASSEVAGAAAANNEYSGFATGAKDTAATPKESFNDDEIPF